MKTPEIAVLLTCFALPIAACGGGAQSAGPVPLAASEATAPGAEPLGAVAAKQRAAITAKGAVPSSSGTFVLEPLPPGAFGPDSGTETSFVSRSRIVTREGQRVQIVNWVTTCKGKRGSFVIRVRLEHVDAGNGYHVGTGTWKFVRGTGRYAQTTGGGRVANAWVESGRWTERREGFLTLR